MFGEDKNRIARAGDGSIACIRRGNCLVSRHAEHHAEDASPVGQCAIDRQMGSTVRAGKVNRAGIARGRVIELIPRKDRDAKRKVLWRTSRTDHHKAGRYRGRRWRWRSSWRWRRRRRHRDHRKRTNLAVVAAGPDDDTGVTDAHVQPRTIHR